MMVAIALFASSGAVSLAALLAMRGASKSPATRLTIGRSATLASLFAVATIPFTLGRLPVLLPMDTSAADSGLALTVPARSPETAPVATPFPPRDLPGTNAPSPARNVAPLPETTTPDSPNRLDYWILAWALGSLGVVVYSAIGVAGIARLRARSQTLNSGPACEILAELFPPRSSQVPYLRASDDIATPMLVGLSHPTILLPNRLIEESHRATLRAVLAHELSHLDRRTIAWSYLSRMIFAMLWFQPLLAWVHRETSEAEEELSDIDAIQAGTSPHEYAACLLEIAEARHPRPLGLAVGMAVRSSRLSKRVRAIVEFDGKAMRRVPAWAVVSILFAALATTALGGMLIGPTQSSTSDEGHALWNKVSDAYSKLKYFESQVEADLSYGKYVADFSYEPAKRLQFTQWKGRPNENEPTRMTADGKYVFFEYSTSHGQYVQAPQMGADPFDLLRKRIAPSGFSALGWFFGRESSFIQSQWKSAPMRIIGSEMRDGVRVKVLQIGDVTPGFAQTTLYIGDKDFLIREARSTTLMPDGKEMSDSERYTHIRSRPSSSKNVFRFVFPFNGKAFREKSADHTSPEVQKLLEGMIEARQKIRSGMVDLVDSRIIDGRTVPTTRHIEFSGSKLRVEQTLENETVVTISDGRRVVAVDSKNPPMYAESDSIAMDVVRMMVVGSAAQLPLPRETTLSELTFDYLGLPMALSLRDQAVTLAGEKQFEGETVLVLNVRPYTFVPNDLNVKSQTLYVSKRDLLIRYQMEFDTPGVMREGRTAVARNVRLNVDIPEDRFKIDIPPDAKRYRSRGTP